MKNPRLPLIGISSAVLFASVPPARAQGIQTGVITGTIDFDGWSAPAGRDRHGDVAESAGPRIAVTDANGVYYLRGLTPGPYRVTFEIPAFQPASREDVQVNAGGIATVDATMPLAGVTETVTVTRRRRRLIATPRTSQTYKKAEVDALPVGRRPLDIAELAPGVTTNAFNAAQLDAGGQLRLRQRVHGQRRRRQRQRLRHAEQPVHRGRDRGDDRADARHLGGVRPLLRRRHQRRHAQRRQHLQRQLPRGADESGVDRADAAREDRQHQARRRPEQDARGHVRRPDGRATGCGSSPPAARDGQHSRTRSRRTAPATPAPTRTAAAR